jgi:hypothetical protein
LFVQWIQVYEFNDHLLAMILRALDAEFADYEIYAANDGDLIIVASPTALPAGPVADFASWRPLRPLAERVRMGSLAELEVRRLAGKRTIRPLLQVFGDGLNSDYYPLVDQEAPKARFAGDVANGLMRTATAPVPVQEIMGDAKPTASAVAGNPIAPPMRLTLTRSARDSIAFLRDGAVPDGNALLPRDIGLLRAVVMDCASLPPRVSLPDLMHDVAVVVNPMAERAAAAAMWKALREGRCAGRMTAGDKAWLGLFEAVAARDVARMAALGAELAGAADINDDLRGYAVMAGALGLVASDRPADAERFLAAFLPRLSQRAQKDPPLQLIRVLARTSLQQQAAAAAPVAR